MFPSIVGLGLDCFFVCGWGIYYSPMSKIFHTNEMLMVSSILGVCCRDVVSQ